MRSAFILMWLQSFHGNSSSCGHCHQENLYHLQEVVNVLWLFSIAINMSTDAVVMKISFPFKKEKSQGNLKQ